MRNFFLVAVVYSIAALALENGVFPLLGDGFGFFPWGQARLIALGVILTGILRGELQALAFALPAAFLAGSVSGQGSLGCTIVSFSLLAFIAPAASRRFYLDRFWIRFSVIFILILGESLVWSLARHAFWASTTIEIQWPVHLVIALIAAIAYPLLARKFTRPGATPTPIGRRASAV